MPTEGNAWTLRRRRSFLAALLHWAEKHGRHLPWRACGDPYRVWLSEIMLQQTTVAAVVPYFERFLQRFPTLRSLAKADESEVLRLWEGLGYYRRARHLHAAARQIVADHAGTFPRDLATLRELPGVGRYTAGAIVSFAFQQPAPIVEANTQRLYARLLGEDREVAGSAAQRALWDFATDLVETTATEPTTNWQPGEINQSLMDLGAIVCTPTQPACPDCPVQRWCAAFAQGTQHAIPRLAKRPELTDVVDATVAIEADGKYLLRRRTPAERWAGLWDFPRYTIPAENSLVTVVVEGVRGETGLEIMLGPEVTSLKHGVTRYRILLRCFQAEVIAGTLRCDAELAWVAPTEFASYPLSMTGRKFANWLITARERLF
jgi:A/G-specific adenine glycosylase